MNKNLLNMLIAFLVILVSFRFFTSPFYYEKVLRKPYPFENKKTKTTEQEKEGTEIVKKKAEEQKELLVIPDNTDTTPVGSESEPIKDVADTVEPAAVIIDTIWVETDKLVCGITERGGRIISLKTKEYTYSSKKSEEQGVPIELISQDNDNGGANLSINDENFDMKIFNFEGGNTRVFVDKRGETTLQFIHTSPNDSTRVIKEFGFKNGVYKIGYTIKSEELDGKNVSVGWKCGITESEAGSGRSAQYDIRKMHLFDGKNVEHISMKKAEKKERTGYYSWAGITSKYFLIALVPDSIRDVDIEITSFEIKDTSSTGKKNKKYNYSFVNKRFASGSEESYWIYAGPSKLTEMKHHKIGLQKVLFRGYRWFFWADKWFPQICEIVLWLLIILQKGVADYGVVIILLTIILKVVTYPLTQSSMKSMNKMKEIQPKISKIREKNKGNPKQMNKKIMEFYKKEGVNPMGGMGGCLPMMLQMPIMISLFIVLRKAIELRGEGTFLIPWIRDLSQAEVLFPLGFNIPIYGSNVALLPIIMGVLMYFQNKATIKDPNQKAMIYMMPVMMLVMFNNFPSGLCLYFTFSTALQILQQKITDKNKNVPGGGKGSAISTTRRKA